MKKKNKKTKEPKPEQFKTVEEFEEAMEQYNNSRPIYSILNIFIGGRNTVKKIESDVEGKPNTPPY